MIWLSIKLFERWNYKVLRLQLIHNPLSEWQSVHSSCSHRNKILRTNKSPISSNLLRHFNQNLCLPVLQVFFPDLITFRSTVLWSSRSIHMMWILHWPCHWSFCFGCFITSSSSSFSSISWLHGSYCIFFWASFKYWFSCCHSAIFEANSALAYSNALFATITCWVDVSTLSIILAICSSKKWSLKLSTEKQLFWMVPQLFVQSSHRRYQLLMCKIC